MLEIAGNKFTIGKEVYYPFAVEIHYFRVEKRYWSICFERIRKAGFRIISTAVPWNLHQDAQKDIDFTGFADPRKDLIVFLELAREFGFKVILRPGPRIGGQWPYGGLPRFLFKDIEMLARDAQGIETKVEDDCGVPGGYLPSYLHPHFLHFLRNYFKTFVETTKNYIHPRGPIFMVELDFETSFGRRLKPDSADYNPDVLKRYYPDFLTSIYEDVKKLNREYREKNASFEAVEPPRNFSGKEQKELPKIFDWLRFREFELKTYLSHLSDIFKSYTVEPMFFRSLYFRPGDLLPAFELSSDEEDGTMVGTNVFPEGTYFDLAQKGRYLKGECGFSWAASFISGLAASESELSYLKGKYSDGLRRFYLVAGLASGFKGLNHYMFVDRDHWIGSPLAADGTISSGYEVIRRFNAAILNSKLNELDIPARVCIIGSREYQWVRLLEGIKQFDYVDKLMVDSIGGLCRDLMRLKINYDVRETIDLDRLKKYSLVVMPSAEFMPESTQELIVEMLKKGINVALCGLLPKYDQYQHDCQILSRHMRIKTTLGTGVDMVKHKNGQFTSFLYGHILSTDSKVRKLATVKKKAVAVASSRYKGNLYLFSFDIGSRGDHHKLAFLDSILEENNIVSFMYCSDPSVDTILHKADKKAVLYVVAPPPGELSAMADCSSRDVIVRIDLRKVGIASARIKLTDLFADEETAPIKVTSDSLRRGIPLTVDFPDGKMFLIEKQ